MLLPLYTTNLTFPHKSGRGNIYIIMVAHFLQGTKNTRLKVDALGRQVCFEKVLKYFDDYDYPSCQADCLIENMMNLCNCTGMEYGSITFDHLVSRI